MARVVSRLEDARVALAAWANARATSCSPAGGEWESVAHDDRSIDLISPPYAACYAGVGYYAAMLHELMREFGEDAFTFTLCCGDDPAIAHDALRLGFISIVCDASDAIHVQLQQVADAVGGQVLRRYPTLDASAIADKPN